MKKIFLIYIFTFSNLISQNMNLSQGYIFNGEPYLALNPNNSEHLVVAWMGFDSPGKIAITTRTSFDGGNTWSPKIKISHENLVYSSADPTMAFDKNGNVYLVYIDFDAPVETADSGAIFIRKSTDGGLSWGESVKITDMADYPGKKAIDRPWMVIDKSKGDYSGFIYVTSMNAKGAEPPFNPYIHISTDGGLSWRNKYLDTNNFLAGNWISQPVPLPAVSIDGTFHAVYPSFVYAQNPKPQYIHVYSMDGGNTMDYSIAYVESNPLHDSLAKRAGLLLCDKSDADHLALINIFSPNGDGDIYIWESFNKGLSWTEPLRINDDPVGNGRLQDLVWADFNEYGDLFVSWRDRRNAPDTGFTTSSEMWGAVKYKDHSVFEDNFKISDGLVPYDTILGASSGNDFHGTRFSGNIIYSAWGSNQNSALNIWFAKSTLEKTSIGEIFRMDLNTECMISPNPAKDIISISGYNGKAEIINSLGITVWKGVIRYYDKINISQLDGGIYFLRTCNSMTKFLVIK